MILKERLLKIKSQIDIIIKKENDKKKEMKYEEILSLKDGNNSLLMEKSRNNFFSQIKEGYDVSKANTFIRYFRIGLEKYRLTTGVIFEMDYFVCDTLENEYFKRYCKEIGYGHLVLYSDKEILITDSAIFLADKNTYYCLRDISRIVFLFESRAAENYSVALMIMNNNDIIRLPYGDYNRKRVYEIFFCALSISKTGKVELYRGEETFICKKCYSSKIKNKLIGCSCEKCGAEYRRIGSGASMPFVLKKNERIEKLLLTSQGIMDEKNVEELILQDDDNIRKKEQRYFECRKSLLDL